MTWKTARASPDRANHPLVANDTNEDTTNEKDACAGCDELKEDEVQTVTPLSTEICSKWQIYRYITNDDITVENNESVTTEELSGESDMWHDRPVKEKGAYYMTYL